MTKEPYIDWIFSTLNANARLAEIPGLHKDGALKLYHLEPPKNEELPLIWLATIAVSDKDARTLKDANNLSFEADVQFTVMSQSFDMAQEVSNLIYEEFNAKIRPAERVVLCRCEKPIFDKSEAESDAQETIFQGAVRAKIFYTK